MVWYDYQLDNITLEIITFNDSVYNLWFFFLDFYNRSVFSKITFLLISEFITNKINRFVKTIYIISSMYLKLNKKKIH